MNWFTRCVLVVVGLMVLGGCTVHPEGEREERQAALSAGKGYEKPAEGREMAALGEHATAEEMVRYAMVANADLEQQYWEWRAAIEQVPIDGTQQTNLALSLNTTLMNGGLAWDRTIVGAGNDPMTDIVLPGKLSAAAKRSLENARAAGWRFRKAQFELRRKVLVAYEDYALTAELIRLGEENVQLLQMIATVAEARSQSGAGGQVEILKLRNEADLAKNEVENLRAQLVIQRAGLNGVMNRLPGEAIGVPEELPAARALTGSDQEILDRAARANPELAALAAEIGARHEEIHLAKLQYYPDFDLSASADLKGMAQTLMGGFTVPVLRYEALRAGVEQAEARLRAAEAIRRQAGSDLGAQLVDDLVTVRDADRQLELLERSVLPRARQVVMLARAAYQAGNARLGEMLDGQRAVIDIERLAANLKSVREKRVAEIEAIDAKEIAGGATRPLSGQ